MKNEEGKRKKPLHGNKFDVKRFRERETQEDVLQSIKYSSVLNCSSDMLRHALRSLKHTEYITRVHVAPAAKLIHIRKYVSPRGSCFLKHGPRLVRIRDGTQLDTFASIHKHVVFIICTHDTHTIHCGCVRMRMYRYIQRQTERETHLDT